MIISEAFFLVGTAMAVALVCWLTFSRTRVRGLIFVAPSLIFVALVIVR